MATSRFEAGTLGRKVLAGIRGVNWHADAIRRSDVWKVRLKPLPEDDRAQDLGKQTSSRGVKVQSQLPALTVQA